MKLTRWQKAQKRWKNDPKAKAQAGFWVNLLIYVVVFVLTELLRPKPDIEDAKPAGLGDFRFPTATEGRPVPIIWGTIRQKGPNVIWYGDLKQEPIKEKVKTGMFSSETVVRGFRYFLGLQLALCRGPEVELLRQWISDIELPISEFPLDTDGDSYEIDCPELFGGEELGQGGITGNLRFYTGSLTQTPSSYLTSQQSVSGQTPRYTGTCYIMSSGRVYFGTGTSIKPWSFELRRIPNGLGLSAAESALNGGNDANPANVIYEILTNEEWGLGFDPADINTSDFQAAASTLATEGNGFSYILDRQIDTGKLLRLVEEQIAGITFQDPQTRLWRIALARDDYDIDLQPEITESDMVELINFSRGSFDDTTNQVRIAFNDRNDTYKDTYGFAQDMANIRALQGVNISVTQNFPGVKNRTLANFIAWRQLRTLSYPLVKATIEVDRKFWNTVPGDVIAFTNAQLGLTKLPMRVVRSRLGSLEDGRVRLDLTQDIFTAQPASFSDPGDTEWEEPADSLVAFPAANQVAFETPRAIVARDPSLSSISPRIMATARAAGVEIGFRFRQRNDAGSPSGDFEDAGDVYGPLVLIGELQSALAIGQANPVSSITIVPNPDSQTEIESAFTDTTDAEGDLGGELVNLCVIDPGGSNEEFILVTSAQTSGGNVQLNGVYRGALDSVQRAHAANDNVWLLFRVAGNSSQSIPETNQVDVKLLPFSATDEVEEASATTINFTMDRRTRRPYPPGEVSLNGSAWASSASLEFAGSDAEDYGIDTEMIRRDYRTLNEVLSLTTDAEDLDNSFPAANSTVHDIEVRDDPDGANTLIYTETDVPGDQIDILRINILRHNSGVLPTRLRYVITAKHTDAALALDAKNDLVFDFDVTSALTGDFEFGALVTDADSNDYTATVAGTYNFTLSSAFTAGDVEYRLNGGSWTQLIAAGLTTGNIGSVSVSDTIEVRHRSSDSGALKQLDMVAPGAGQAAFAIFYV